MPATTRHSVKQNLSVVQDLITLIEYTLIDPWFCLLLIAVERGLAFRLIGAKMLARHLRSGIAILILTRLFHVSFSGLRSGCELPLRLRKYVFTSLPFARTPDNCRALTRATSVPETSSGYRRRSRLVARCGSLIAYREAPWVMCHRCDVGSGNSVR
jgi:hypothetical protein